MAYNLFQTPKLTKPVAVYDPTKSVEDNMNGKGQPSAADINMAYQTPQAQLQIQSTGVNGNNESKEESQQPVAKQAIPTVDPNDPNSGMNAITSMYTSPEQEEKMRKASVANQRILAIGDALRHIGNIYHTTKYAPAQQFNSPVTEEQQRYEKGKAVRDAANMKFYTYQQAKAEQDAKQRQWEANFNRQLAKDKAEQELKYKDFLRKQGYTEAQIKKIERDGILARDKFEADVKHKEEQRKETKRHHTVTESQGAQKIAIQRQKEKDLANHRAWQRTSGGGNGKGYIYATKDGYVTIPSDVVGKNNINKNTLLNELKSRGVVDDNWIEGYNGQTKYNKDYADRILDEKIGEWLMTDDDASKYMERHFGGVLTHSEPIISSSAPSTTAVQQSKNFGYTPEWQGGKSLGIGIGSKQNNNGGKKLGIGL